ncbi:hypothetical protein BJ944DRAFT_256292 [Cunninghamella echinulata]|nr:hypothetical protein BJ944DRAFT_256292 [Cunninghamella echinulata]
MRRVYQKSVAIPLNNVEHLWKEYDQWENNLNRLTAKKFLGEKSSAYMTARTALRESRPFTDNLIRNTIPKKPQWTEKEIEQLNLWKRYIQWEKGNPLHLEEKNAIIDRVSYVYQQAFLVLRFYPEIWYDYAMYYIELSKPEKALSILKQAMDILPTSLLVHFAYTEICESRKMLDEAKQGFDSILENLDNEIEKLKESVQVEVNKLTQRLEQERASMNLGDDIDGELREQLREKERRIKKEQDELEDQLKEQVDDIMQRCSLVWIAYMRFARRTDGIKAARALFSRARKTSNRTYHVFIASALMEYHNSKDATVAGKIFGLGNKSFADNEAYVCEYLDFLIQMNDDNNTRALFERSLASLPPEKSTAVWRKFMEYENKYGDLASVQNVESRLREVVPEVTQLDTFVSRYSYLDLQPIAETELGIEDTTPSDIQNISASEPETPQHEDEYDQQAFKEQSIIIGKNGEQKRLLLESVHPERYVRPDLNQWQAFKPSNEPLPPRNVSGNMTLGQAGNKDDHSKRTAKKTSPPPPFAPSSTSTAPGSSESVINKDGQPITTSSTQPQQPPSQQQVPPPQQQQQPLSQAPPPQQIHVPQPSSQQHPTPPLSQQPQRLQPQSPVTNLPDLITYFVTNLPSPSDYKGPILNAIELVDLLRNIALPSVPPNMPMRPQSLPPPSQQQQSSSSHLPPPSQQHPPPRTTILQGPKLSGGRDMPLRGRGRGGKRGGMGMGRGRGMKRKGMRDDNDDDYPINKGMGPNRPPDFDVFRARQAKRHRDDPPY